MAVPSMAVLCGAWMGSWAAGAVLRRPWKPVLLLLSPPAFSTTCARCAKDRRLREKRAISERRLVSAGLSAGSGCLRHISRRWRFWNEEILTKI